MKKAASSFHGHERWSKQSACLPTDNMKYEIIKMSIRLHGTLGLPELRSSKFSVRSRPEVLVTCSSNYQHLVEESWKKDEHQKNSLKSS
jgi:hypothetical protein